MDSSDSSSTRRSPQAPPGAEDRSPDIEQKASADNRRPGSEAFRTVIRSSRYTPEEWEIVLQRAEAAGLSPSRFQRHATLGAPLGRRANREAVIALNRIGVNLNNLIRIAIRSGQPLLAAEAADLFKQIRETMESLL
jgi:hypothetical protein